jgi:hypothetical protein
LIRTRLPTRNGPASTRCRRRPGGCGD